MKRRQFLRVGGLAAAAGAVAPALASAQTPDAKADTPVIWQLASDFPDALDIPRSGVETLASALADITDGAFRIEPARDDKRKTPALDAAREGRVQIAYTTTALYVERDPVFAIGAGLPFGPNARQFNAWLLHQHGLDLLNDSYRPHGLRVLPGGNTGALTGGWFTKEIGSVADFAGLRVSVPGLGGPMLARFGALPQTLFPTDLAAAFQQSRLDVALWSGPHDDERLRLHKSAPFYYYPGWQGASQLSFLVNADAWNALAKPHQAALTAAAARTHDMVQAAYDARNSPAIKRLVAGGAKLKPMPQTVLTELLKATDSLAENLGASNAAFRTLYDSVRLFRTDTYLWWQVAEYTYDNFMIRARAQG
ncbi:TRAP-type mannitol/chloroaromatic compound transport system substrate-binding protein [Pseudochelatococcus lubricantis]|uniref:TRAP-type mannitol/chloroaromatic compound transport system substrate-binding protein n=1 Tax=Pseudochelatococcus lubricantis TaxID=1538102 RepID=A0ABX0UXA8_9HYPH|nr:ABC transporter substrate-binding protein [Pseudochelatococcus lubricantis]NIJ56514.1 TRAP-type mannitol/chloroaromatic compound transport system substrate-binding protein [Pseudochelatococcus lubricantis]